MLILINVEYNVLILLVLLTISAYSISMFLLIFIKINHVNHQPKSYYLLLFKLKLNCYSFRLQTLVSKTFQRPQRGVSRSLKWV